MTHGDPQLNNLLSGFDNPDASEVRVKPNIRMTIKSNNSVSHSNNKGASTRITKCRGKLVRKGGRMVPKIKCSSMKLNSPNKKKAHQAALLQDIFGEVNKQQEPSTFPNYHDMPLKPASSGCGCSKQKQSSCGSSHSIMPIDMNEPPAVFNQAHEAHEELNHEHEESNNSPEELNHAPENTPTTKVKGTRRRRRSKGKGKGKGKKKTHKVVQLSLNGNTPAIPEVRIKRKRRGSGTKKAKSKGKAQKK